MDRPASGARPTALPTETQESNAVQDTPINAAAVGVTGCGVQDAPPLVVARMTPWPVRVPVSVLAVVPTATQRAPLTPGGAVVVVEVGGGGVDVVVGLVGVVVVGPEVAAAVVADVVVAAGPEVVVTAGPVVVVDVKGSPLPAPPPRKQEIPLR
jgi:hypothetical protein